MSEQELIDAAVAGRPTGTPVEIYWDLDNDGPAYRIGQKSGLLEFVGWNTDYETEGYSMPGYFGHGDGRYLGPDVYDVYPTFRIRKEERS